MLDSWHDVGHGMSSVDTILTCTTLASNMSLRGLCVAVLRTTSPVFWHGRGQAVLAIIVPRGRLCCVPPPQVETAMRTSRQRREEPMHRLRVAAPSGRVPAHCG